MFHSQYNGSHLESIWTFLVCFLPCSFSSLCCSNSPQIPYQGIFTFPILPSPRLLKFLYSLYFCPRTAISFLSSWLSCKISLSVVNSQAVLLFSCSLPSCFAVASPIGYRFTQTDLGEYVTVHNLTPHPPDPAFPWHPPPAAKLMPYLLAF